MMNFLKQLAGTLPTPEQIKVGIKVWIKENGKFWGASVGMHVVIFVVLGVAIGAPHVKKVLEEVVFFDTEIEEAVEATPVEHFEVGETPIEPTVLNTETLTEPPAATIEQDAQFNDSSAVFTEAGGGTASSGANLGGLGGFDVTAFGGGPAVRGPGGVSSGVGESTKGGSGGTGEGFGGRGTGSRQKNDCQWRRHRRFGACGCRGHQLVGSPSKPRWKLGLHGVYSAMQRSELFGSCGQSGRGLSNGSDGIRTLAVLRRRPNAQDQRSLFEGHFEWLVVDVEKPRSQNRSLGWR